MADDELLDKIHDLSDLELAILLGLVNREHCLVSTPQDNLELLTRELRLVSSETFGLRCAVLHCQPSMNLDDFASGLLVPFADSTTPQPRQHAPYSGSYFAPRQSFSNPHKHLSIPSPERASVPPSTQARIANCVLAVNLDQAPKAVQIQALELLRTRRIFTRTSVQTTPKQFIFVPILAAASGGQARLTRHLNDLLFISHWHDPETGYVNLEEKGEVESQRGDGDGGDDASSANSAIQTRPRFEDDRSACLLTNGDVSQLSRLSREVRVDVDVVRYQMNIVSFLRMHRAVADGVTPMATKHFGQLMRCLAPLHKLNYVTPAIVGLAAHKIYMHRLMITSAEGDRSLQWGSKLESVRALLDGVEPEDVIVDVLELVTAPV